MKGCYYCERQFSNLMIGELSGGTLVIKTKDHIIPISKGGTNKSRNLVACCSDCNTLKGGMLLEEFHYKVTRMIKNGSHKNYKKEEFERIPGNIQKLIKKILPYRTELIKPIKQST